MVQSLIDDTLDDLTELTEQIHTKSQNGGWPNHLKFYEPGTNLKIIKNSQSSIKCISPVSYSDGNALAFCPEFLELVCIRTQEVLWLFL